ncbi:hypothetical protein [Marivirga sp.]|uniref:hypothetical protein n=1 Tax=Marivirga sp. TaxID=2018662 RepID=UPI002D809908|nr:hypothetical protein [Marivirga sp.]HET8860479.1 hypothetical protein [Marivirga sp.]
MKKKFLQIISAPLFLFILTGCFNNEPLWPKTLDYAVTYTVIEDSNHTGFKYEINGTEGGIDYSFGDVNGEQFGFPYNNKKNHYFSGNDEINFEFKAISPIDVTLTIAGQEYSYSVLPEDGIKTFTVETDYVGSGSIEVNVERTPVDESQFLMKVEFPGGSREHDLGFHFSKGGNILQSFSATASKKDTIVLSVISPYSFEIGFITNDGQVVISDSVVSKDYIAKGTLKLIPGVHF